VGVAVAGTVVEVGRTGLTVGATTVGGTGVDVAIAGVSVAGGLVVATTSAVGDAGTVVSTGDAVGAMGAVADEAGPAEEQAITPTRLMMNALAVMKDVRTQRSNKRGVVELTV